MFPFYALQLPPEATDDEVEARYQELVRTYPPDRAPERFAEIRRAYEALRDRRARIATRLFYFDAAGTALTLWDASPATRSERPRLSTEEVALLVRRRPGSGADRSVR